MDTFNLIGLVVLGLIGAANVWLSITLTLKSWRRYRAVRPRSDRMSVGE